MLFRSQKIVAAACRIARGEQQSLALGDLSVQRDWGWAPEYVVAMHRMLQLDELEDFVIATGCTCSLEEFVEHAFAAVGLDWRRHVVRDPRLVRPTEIEEFRIAVLPFKQFSALAGGLALGIMMIPIMARTTEELLLLVPSTMREGALALGATRARAVFTVLLPAALPGIVTGVALRNTFIRFGWDLGYLSVVVGHATFCIVVVYNNALARLRRLGGSLADASADLGAGPFTTFRRITLPLMRSAIIAGAVLAFGLSFDEIIVKIGRAHV